MDVRVRLKIEIRVRGKLIKIIEYIKAVEVWNLISRIIVILLLLNVWIKVSISSNWKNLRKKLNIEIMLSFLLRREQIVMIKATKN